jgi:hypothetical protein
MMATPFHSIGVCPICGDGLCGIRTYESGHDSTYGLIVCDECDAIWTEPDLSAKPHFPDTEDERSPVDGQPIWGPTSHWADLNECARLGWLESIDPRLNHHGQQPGDDDPLHPPVRSANVPGQVAGERAMTTPQTDHAEKPS